MYLFIYICIPAKLSMAEVQLYLKFSTLPHKIDLEIVPIFLKIGFQQELKKQLYN